MNIAVTGGTGFIGSHLINKHLELGDTVRYLTRQHKSNKLSGAQAFIGNLNGSIDALREFLKDVDVLYHCAAEVRYESEMYTTNVHGTANLIAAAQGRVARWVQLSSTGVYGKHPGSIVTEDTDLKPDNTYEKSKAESDKLFLNAINRNHIQGVILRPSIVYGPDMPNQSIFQFIKAIDRNLFFFIGKNGAIVNYIHVDNVVDALIRCGTSPSKLNGRTYIVSDFCTIEEFVKIVSVSLGKRVTCRRFSEKLVRSIVSVLHVLPNFPLSMTRIDALTSRTIYDSELIKKELNFKCIVSIETGISLLTDCYKNR